MNYELRHMDTPLIRFSVLEESNTPEIDILWVNEEQKHREGLSRLLDFKFEKHSKYNLPNKRLKLIEEQIRERARLLLQ